MLELALTTDCCRDMIQMLLKRGWTLKRIARATDRPVEYIQRVQSRRQSFQMSDVQALAKACKVKPYRFFFDALRRDSFPPEMRELYDMGKQEVERQEQFERILRRRPSKRRRASTKAA